MSKKERFEHIDSLFLIFGLSGAGKSTASKALSDFGYYAIDNLPVALAPRFLALLRQDTGRFKKTSILFDVHSTAECEQLLSFLDAISTKDKNRIRIIYMDASVESIVRRYSETRRPHPLLDGKNNLSLADAIKFEQKILLPIREITHKIIDSSQLTIHDLRRSVLDMISGLEQSKNNKLKITLQSFGFKYGAPLDCDLVMDVRFLPNPHFVDSLRNKTGKENEVVEYILKNGVANDFIERFSNLLSFLIPHYTLEGKAYLKIGIGCTGGKHRSVCIVEKLASKIVSTDSIVSIIHRELADKRQ